MHGAQEALVDFVDDFHVSRQKALEEAYRPDFESLGKKCVVGVPHHLHRDVPCGVRSQTLLVHQDAQQFRNGYCGVRVIELDGDKAWKISQIARLLQEAPDDVCQRTGDEEVLLLESQLLPGLKVVVRI